jgi:hypothetical protein
MGEIKLPMLANTGEKRSCIRYHFMASIIYAPFNTNNYHDGEVVDVSEKGMSFRSRVPLKPGSAIFIRTQKYCRMISNANAEIRPRTVTLAEVKWCRELTSKYETLFDIGVIYLYPD